MRALRAVAAAGLCVASVLVPAYGQEHQLPGEYVSFLPAYIITDRVLADSGHGVAFTGSYGRPLRDRFGLEFGVSATVLDSGIPGGTDFYQKWVHVDGIYNFTTRRPDAFVPFALLGVGLGYDDFYPDSRDKFTGLLEAGVGLSTAQLLGGRFRLRAEFRYVYDTSQRGHHEPRVGLGVEFPLGVRQ